MCACQIDQFKIDAFFTPNEMPLNFNENIFAAKRVEQQFRPVCEILESARVWRANASPARTEDVLAIANFSERLFRRDAETSTRDACAPQNSLPRLAHTRP